MAAPQYVGSRTGQSEERAGSVESFVVSRRTLPTMSHVSFERPVSPGQVAEPPGKSLWERICEEYEAEMPAFPEVYKAKREAVIPVSIAPPARSEANGSGMRTALTAGGHDTVSGVREGAAPGAGNLGPGLALPLTT
ncbi:IQ domain-containing protein K [Pteropus vampyrus]|uniref:IQ domain-containing protein K n=1 Tax=Pteropus vampyrus TaxID=132908 RepID=A0A6P3R5W9_PTEVA|nr:IQ domain-containing protein K [Pteropus vampyrus]